MTASDDAPDRAKRPGDQAESGQAQWILNAINVLREDLRSSEGRLREAVHASEGRLKEEVQAAEARLKTELDGVGKRVRTLEKFLFIGIGAAGVIGAVLALLIRIIPFDVTVSVQAPDKLEVGQPRPGRPNVSQDGADDRQQVRSRADAHPRADDPQPLEGNRAADH